MKLWKTIKEQGRRERAYLRAVPMYKKFVYVMDWLVAGAASYALVTGMIGFLYIAQVALEVTPHWFAFVVLSLVPFFPLYSTVDRQQMRIHIWELQQRERAANRALLKSMSKQMADSLGVDDATP